jgi:hypothetical protein
MLKLEAADKFIADAKKEGKDPTLETLRKQGIVMDDKQWMARIIFLESIAGVPGMVAGVLRHLKSLRGLKRDSGWIRAPLRSLLHAVLTYFNRHAPIGSRKRKDAFDELPHRPPAFSLYEIAHPWRTRRLLQRLLCGLPNW